MDIVALPDIEPWIVAAIFAVSFFGSLLFVPWLVIRLPADYFLDRRRKSPWRNLHPALRVLLLIGKNLLGIVLVLMGIAMLVLPGQGLLTILIGTLLLDFPGKFRCQRWMIRRKSIRRAVNWLRNKWHKPPFDLG
jgi:hypothetical protein